LISGMRVPVDGGVLFKNRAAWDQVPLNEPVEFLQEILVLLPAKTVAQFQESRAKCLDCVANPCILHHHLDLVSSFSQEACLKDKKNPL